MKPLHDILVAVYRQDLTLLRTLDATDLCTSDEDGRTALVHAVLAEDASTDVVRLLVRRGVPMDARDRPLGWTALHFAVSTNKAAIVRVLLEGGADPSIADGDGRLPRDLAGDDAALCAALDAA